MGIRKHVALGLVSALALGALAGCGSTSSTSSASSGAAQSSGNQQLQIFSWWTGVASSKALKALIGVFNQEYPHIQVINEAVAGGAGSNAKAVLASRMEAGNPPGTFQVHAGNGSLLSWIQAGDMAPLNSLYQSQGWYHDFPKSLLNMLTVNGKIYAVPVDMQRANVLWYNPKIFNQYHLTPPTTFNQFFADAAVLQSHGITPLALANHGNWETTLLYSDVLLGTVGPKEYTALLDGKASWNSPGVVTATNTFLHMMQYTNSDYEALHWQQADQMVAQGQAAMNVMGDWAQGYFTTDLHLTPGTGFGWAPTPGTQGTFAMVSDVFGLPAKLSNPTPTLDFLKVLGSLKGQDTFNPLKGTFSPRLDADKSLYDAYSQSAMNSFKKDTLVLVIGQGGANPGFTQAFENAMVSLVSSHNVNQFISAVQSAAAANPL
ncbi:extracellular solute-binding protein family 1 [Sulfobacillus acidophilus TPY]|uniref:Probable sugar-binding periplasmic protein n=1 Tax=Sulfobacillus acidophilus (strain ATCC 700253 / DSM 10332 / NAL) TaxID=679936 RepID=G8TSK3_SULAD|nr:extracellular solute-binding protein family 1 [Sulfobacillus acidophilus TPY]AEW06695.1 carbohydrate ABC transporter substrate-binding protein, CUT1 family [Sulfobacillus acidophilus DSM 10332]